MKTKIQEHLYNTFGWRLSDREEELINVTLDREEDIYKEHQLSEREEYIIRLSKEYR